jgi:hypothetical protein
MKSMMRDHLAILSEQVAARLRGDSDAEIAAYEKGRDQALQMADALSDGLRQQFPQKVQ